MAAHRCEGDEFATAGSSTLALATRQTSGPISSTSAQDQPSQAAKPSPPLALRPPPEPPSKFEGADLKTVPADPLAAVARQLYDDKKYLQAIQLLHHAIKRGADGGYDLACEYALAGKKEEALYWLQKTALEEGVDADWAAEDPGPAQTESLLRYHAVFTCSPTSITKIFSP
jgi:hypothetical protein